jgi:hypothetical protein
MLSVCPYCGHESPNQSRCEQCKGLMDPLSRQASQNAMGPWFIRDESAPFRPGCSYETLRALVAKGRVTRRSIIRGPSTRQFWTRASSVPGVAHLLGECHACHTSVTADFARCPACAAEFDCSMDRQSLGLAPIRLLPGHAAPEEIARSMVDAVRFAQSGGASAPEPPAVHAANLPIEPLANSRHRRQKNPRTRVALIALLAVTGLIIIACLTLRIAAPDVFASVWRALLP